MTGGPVRSRSWRTSLTGWRRSPAGVGSCGAKSVSKETGGSSSTGVWVGSTHGATASPGWSREVENVELAQAEGSEAAGSAVQTRTCQVWSVSGLRGVPS